MHTPEPACCWLKATDTAERGRYAGTTTYVTANAENGAPSTDQSPLSPRGASSSLLRIIGVNSLPEDGITAIITASKRQKQVQMRPYIYMICTRRLKEYRLKDNSTKY